jgi:hypothetical protein
MYYQKCNRVNLFRRNINFIEFEITKNLAENQNDINREEETCLQQKITEVKTCYMLN